MRLALLVFVVGCAEHHRVEDFVPIDVGPRIDVPTTMGDPPCTIGPGVCLMPNAPSCPDFAPEVGERCDAPGLTCQYCPGGDVTFGGRSFDCTTRRAFDEPVGFACAVD